MNEFLKTEYEQCIGLIKFYDERHQSLAKFAAGLSAAVPAFIVTILRFGGDDLKADIPLYVGFLSMMTAVGLMVVYISMVQNRLYFVYPARQVNSIRGLMTSKLAEEGFQNQMYVAVNFSAWKWMSSQCLLLLLVAVQTGIFSGFTVFFFLYNALGTSVSAWSGVLTGLGLAAVIFILSAYYLLSQGKKAADTSIHRE